MASYDEALQKMYSDRLTRFYRNYDEAKVASVPTLLQKYKGKEEQLLAAMVKKYGPEDKVPIYCPLNGLPPEYCEYYPDYDKTRPWIAEHCPHLLKGEDEAGDVGKKGKRGGGVIKKKTISADKQKVIISKEVRNKKKAVTSVEGLETFSVKLKDAAKVFGKKFAASSSVKEKDSGGQEIVIQGDVIWDLPALLEKEYKIPKSKIFEREKGGKLSKVR